MLEIKHPTHKHLNGRRGADHRTGGLHYYVLATVGKDQMLWGAYRTREQAERIGLTRANGMFEVIPLETSDLSTASQILREKGIMEQGLSSSSFRKFRHI